MITDKHRKLAKRFRDMHSDTGSVYVFEKQEFGAVATSSARISYVYGYSDGEDIIIDDLILSVEQIIRRINISLKVR